MLMAQISERRELNAVFADLFDSDGNEVYLKRAECYVIPGRTTPWLAVQKVARDRREVAIGYMKFGQNPLINPPQLESIVFSDEDRIIVLAEDDSEAVGDARGGELSEAPAAMPEPKPEPKASAQKAPEATPTAQRSALLPPEAPKTANPVSAGPRVTGPSTQPRAPLPPKPK